MNMKRGVRCERIGRALAEHISRGVAGMGGVVILVRWAQHCCGVEQCTSRNCLLENMNGATKVFFKGRLVIASTRVSS